ncbi:GNAT family N-acetyltransferase [Flammeovirga kamogawensis]|uniref:GNAT family N-acetyltransferase n=1 Tax=Flammeovirga kamogawensis TaxID=373891 RepID=A0ABX8GUC1_9BACT|nr:GNAT family N-acetyltransferase [Flammeovirga kamogawensis]MBB6459823.1 RimJ/RimL family protein N-acetyltransferase [Flammeovirga kamogawensis]QWG07121.1 GNAT family N-acetyltransferase [Flammeovirga kamogawensis]TRX68943.1 GNAT family N-acetyltransferase [Flammeovirga kamogawensis]
MEVKLRTLKKSDREQITELINNKKIVDNLRDDIPHPYSLEDADYFIDFTQKQSPAENFGIITENQELCGVISLKRQSDIFRMTAEVGYWIGEKYWKEGIASKAVRLITKYGFEELQLERIYAGVFGYNTASMKVLEKNGYTKEGISRNSIIKNNIIHDQHIFSKLKNEH